MSISCDVYALGAVLTELFGMKPIWEEQTNCSIIYLVAHQGQMPNPADVQAIVNLCLCPLCTRPSAATVPKHVVCLVLT